LHGLQKGQAETFIPAWIDQTDSGLVEKGPFTVLNIPDPADPVLELKGFDGLEYRFPLPPLLADQDQIMGDAVFNPCKGLEQIRDVFTGLQGPQK